MRSFVGHRDYLRADSSWSSHSSRHCGPLQLQDPHQVLDLSCDICKKQFECSRQPGRQHRAESLELIKPEP